MNRLATAFLVLNLIVIDVAGSYFIFRNYFSKQAIQDDTERPEAAIPNRISDGCDTDCQQKIYTAIDSVRIDEKNVITPSAKPTPTSAPVKLQTNSQKTKSVSYLPIPGSGSVLNTNWTEIPGTDFYLSKSDYQGLLSVYFEANLKLQNGNGIAYVRIFDKTHSIAPSGGELNTSSQTSTFVSTGPVYLWEGNNHYVIVARSSTSDTTVFESGRLKITSLN